MAFVSLSCSVTVQEASSSLKPAYVRTSLAPLKGAARRSLDVTAHVLTTHLSTSSQDVHAQPAPAGVSQPAPGNADAAGLHALWTPTWTRSLQTKFSAVWEKWAKLSTQFGQNKSLRPDWVGLTQELFDQKFQRVLAGVAAARSASGASVSTSSSQTARDAAAASAAAAAAVGRPISLTPYLTVADEVEVSFAAMLADLCNMAYEVDKIDLELIEARHHLSVIATSLTHGASCSLVPASPTSSPSSPSSAAAAFDSGSEAEGPLQPRARGSYSIKHQHQHAQAQGLADLAEDATNPGMVSFTMGGSPPLSPSISMLQLTSPEAVTAALTSQGHGAAFAHPVYVSTLHHHVHHAAFTSMGSCDEEGDISDLEWRAAMAAAGPGGIILGGGGAGAQIGSLGTMGTMGSIDDAVLSGLGISHSQHQTYQADGLVQTNHVGMQATASGTMGTMDFVGGAAVGATGRASAAAAAAAPGMFISDCNLTEERDFVAGQVYGYMTQLVERRPSSDAGGVVEEAAAAAQTTQSGAAGGRALREEQRMRRPSSSGSLAGIADGGMAAAAAVGMVGSGEAGLAGPDGGPPVVVACTKAPPSAWFACDDKLTKTRYFAIQGSTSLEHWQINLQFEPVVFEDPKYGVRIHRGVYEAAKTLYDDIVPLVREHLETSPYASVSFAGHSLGGSLGTVLTLLMVIRGVLKPSNISPVYTFGAPAVFCQGAVPNAPHDRCATCMLDCEMRPSGASACGQAAGGHAHQSGGACSCGSNGRASAAATMLGGLAAAAAAMEQEQVLPLGLMARLGLSEDQVVNVIMHKDIVPRAFVCDYTAVAGVLQRWVPSFRDHHSLSDDAGLPHKSLYNFVGRVAVLRPSPHLPFVNGPADAAHPMLPNHPALYRVGLNDDAMPIMDQAASSMASWDDILEGLSNAMASAAANCSRRGGQSAAATAKRAAKLAGMQKSVMQFMNQPHPLNMLSDYQAYGPNGCISRFHNPDNYTRALYGLLGR